MQAESVLATLALAQDTIGTLQAQQPGTAHDVADDEGLRVRHVRLLHVHHRSRQVHATGAQRKFDTLASNKETKLRNLQGVGDAKGQDLEEDAHRESYG